MGGKVGRAYSATRFLVCFLFHPREWFVGYFAPLLGFGRKPIPIPSLHHGMVVSFSFLYLWDDISYLVEPCRKKCIAWSYSNYESQQYLVFLCSTGCFFWRNAILYDNAWSSTYS